MSGNRADTNGGGIVNGSTASSKVFSSTITGNKANITSVGGVGGGVFNLQGGTFTFQNTILARNDLVFVFDECAGSLQANGPNLMKFFDDTRCTVAGTAPILADPQLGLLQNNGGPTANPRAASRESGH